MSSLQIGFPSGRLESNFRGFSKLTNLHKDLAQHGFETIEIDFSACSWFDANMCAPLGAVLTQATSKLNDLCLVGLSTGIRTILEKNRFLENYRYNAKPDIHETTIRYQRFNATDKHSFAEYLYQHLEGKGIPKMSNALRGHFEKSLFEVFVNAVMHSESEVGVFACGQFFPAKHAVDISIADGGIGIRRKMLDELDLRMNSDQAIEWALQEGHTTRKGDVPGGLGLKLIREFIILNRGRIQITSDSGYWELFPEGEKLTRFDYPFPGTAINIEINTADNSSYRLASEA